MWCFFGVLYLFFVIFLLFLFFLFFGIAQPPLLSPFFKIEKGTGGVFLSIPFYAYVYKGGREEGVVSY